MDDKVSAALETAAARELTTSGEVLDQARRRNA
jgi:hypothetical protein